MADYKARFQVGEVVASWNSGKDYIVLAVYPLDECGSFAYSVRGWRGGNFYGPTRQIAECRLNKENGTVIPLAVNPNP